jgi:CRISPR-associated protein Csy1
MVERFRALDPEQPLAAARAAFGRSDWEGALAAAEQAINRAPDSVEALVLGVNSALRCDRLQVAIPWLEALLRLHPHQVQFQRMLSTALNNLGSGQQQAGESTAALSAYTRALAVWPDNPDALFNRAKLALAAGQNALALPDLRRLVANAPGDQAAAVLLAETEIAFDDAQPPRLARAALARLSRVPGVDALRLALAQADAGDGEAALASVIAIEDLAVAPRGASIATRLAENADAPRARAAFGHVAALAARGVQPFGLNWAIGQRLSLPQVYASRADLAAERAGFIAGLAALQAEYDPSMLARCAPRLEQLLWTNFLLAYQGHDDSGLLRDWGRFAGRCLDTFAPQLREPLPVRRPGPPRVGFLSSAFRYSTVGSYFASWVGAAHDAGWQVEVFQLGPVFDDFTSRIGARCQRLHRLDAPLAVLATQIRDADLDLLVMPDLGVDARIAVLGALSLARRQVMAWGQPCTSGSDRIDAFIGCASMEPQGASAHYTERLLLLPGIGTDYARPDPPRLLSRAELGLPRGHLYLVPQSPYKIHPDADAAIAAIAASDPDATLVFFGGDRPRSIALLRRRLGDALRAVGAQPERQLMFLPLVQRSRFLSICAACDVMVDTPHWSGGNTTIDALLSGLPVVSVPGGLMRGRQSMAMLGILGLEELIQPDAAAQARTAIAVATDGARRAEIARRIADGLPALFDGRAALAALQGHFRTLLAEAGADPA